MRWTVLMALMFLLAGCTDDGADAPDPGHDDGDGDEGHNGTDDGHDAENNGTSNRPPTISIDVNVTGEGPFQAEFTLHGTDPDGDSLAWTLDADGDNETDASGETLPANASFEYAGNGTYLATFNVTDGFHDVTVQVNVTAEADGPALQPFVGSGTAASPCPQCTEAGANTGAGYRAGESGVDSVFLDIPPEYIGQPFVATASGGDIDLAFRDACDGGGTGGGLVGDPYVGSGDPEGIVPEGTICVLMWNVDSPDTELTITIAG